MTTMSPGCNFGTRTWLISAEYVGLGCAIDGHEVMTASSPQHEASPARSRYGPSFSAPHHVRAGQLGHGHNRRFIGILTLDSSMNFSRVEAQ